MQPDSLAFNLVVFVVAQVIGLAYLHTGLSWRGVRLMMATCMLADIALVSRFALHQEGFLYTIPIWSMQAYVLLELPLFCGGRLVRRMAGRRQRRKELIRQAFIHYLRNELAPAGKIYRRLLRADPWDLQSRVGLASVTARSGKPRRARRLLRSARGLAAQQGWSDLIAAELRSKSVPPVQAP